MVCTRPRNGQTLPQALAATPERQRPAQLHGQRSAQLQVERQWQRSCAASAVSILLRSLSCQHSVRDILVRLIFARNHRTHKCGQQMRLSPVRDHGRQQTRSTYAPWSRQGPSNAQTRSTNAPRFREGPSNVQGGVGRTLSGQDRAGQLTVVPQPFAVSSPERQRPAQLERFRRPVAKPQRSAQVLGAVSAVSTVRTSAFRGES